jgi:hypothetical protein
MQQLSARRWTKKEESMMRCRTSVVWAILLAVGLSQGVGVEASKGSGASKGGGTKTVHVKGDTKKNGTYVAPHESRASSTKGSKREPSSRAGELASPTRDERGRIQRSAAARHAFARQTGFPNGRPGYVIDHVVPLACGGADAPSNMQWQTVADGKTKDRTERRGCR